MSAPKGNKNAVGNRGGRRKSAYQELADALRLHKAFFSKQSNADLLAKLQSGEYSIFDMLIARGHSGNERVLKLLADKIFATKVSSKVEVQDINSVLDDLEDEDISKKRKKTKK